MRRIRNCSMFEIFVEPNFAALHSLRNQNGKSQNLHGHTYNVQVGLQRLPLNENGFLFVFVLKGCLRVNSEYFDHHFVNELKPFDEINRTAESISGYTYEDIQDDLAGRRFVYVRV